MAAVQAADARASFLFVGDLNGHHQEWLGSTQLKIKAVATVDCGSIICCDIGAVRQRNG